MTISAFLYILAFVLFLMASVNIPSSRVNLMAAGLACLSAAGLFGGGGFSFGH